MQTGCAKFTCGRHTVIIGFVEQLLAGASRACLLYALVPRTRLVSIQRTLCHVPDLHVPRAGLKEFFMGCLRFRGSAKAMDVGKVIQDQDAWALRCLPCSRARLRSATCNVGDV